MKEWAYKGIFITPDQYLSMLDSQGGRCAVCAELFVGSPQLDHDHSTGKVRAFLCVGCNNGLGCFRDRTDYLEKAIVYLKKHSSGAK